MDKISLYALSGVAFVNSCIDGAIIPVALSLSRTYGNGSEWWVPVLASAFRMGTILGFPTLGCFADKSGYRGIGVVALVFSIILTFTCIFAEELILVLLLRAGLGFFSFDLIGTNWINRNSITPKIRRGNLAVYGLMQPMGAVFGMLVSGIVDSFDTSLYSWKIVNIIWCVALFFAVPILVKFVRPPMTDKEIEEESGRLRAELETSRKNKQIKPNPSGNRKAEKSQRLTDTLSQRHDGEAHSLHGTIWRNKNHFFLCVCFGATVGFLVTLVVILCVEDLAFSSLHVSLTFVGFVAAYMSFIVFVYPRLVKRIGLVYTLLSIVVGMIIVDTISTIIISWGASFIAVLVLTFFHHVGAVSGEICNKTLLLEQIPFAIEGRVMGIFFAVRQCAVVLGSYASVFLYKDVSQFAPWLARAILLVLGLLLFCHRFFSIKRAVDVRLDSSESLDDSQDAESGTVSVNV